MRKVGFRLLAAGVSLGAVLTLQQVAFAKKSDEQKEAIKEVKEQLKEDTKALNELIKDCPQGDKACKDALKDDIKDLKEQAKQDIEDIKNSPSA